MVSGSAFATALEDIVRETVSTNPEVLIVGSQRDSVEQQMEQTRAGFFPQVDLSVGTGWEYNDTPITRGAGHGSRNFNRDESDILIRQLLFDGQGTKSEFERQRARTNARAFETFSTSEVVALKASEVYFDVIREQKLVALAVNNLSNHQKTYNRIYNIYNRSWIL